MLGWLWVLFLGSYSISCAFLLISFVLPLHVHAQRGGSAAAAVQASPSRRSLEAEQSMLDYRISVLESWKDRIDASREMTILRLERIESGEKFRDTVVISFAVPVLLVMLKEIGAFIRSALARRG